MHNKYTKILSNISKFFEENKKQHAVIGLSGGIDSSLTLKLIVDALGAENVTAILMPEKGISLNENIQHAKMLCQFFQVEMLTSSINKFLADYSVLPWTPTKLAHINTKARIRMTLLYSFANTKNALVIGSTSKTELSIGYGTKYGDLAADIYVIGDLYKTEVKDLARHLELPEELIEKTPSAELYKDQTDESELGMKYNEIDSILKQYTNGVSKEVLLNKGISPNTVQKTIRMYHENQHKREKTPIINAN